MNTPHATRHTPHATRLIAIALALLSACSAASAQDYVDNPQDIIRKVKPGEGRETPRTYYDTTRDTRSSSSSRGWESSSGISNGVYVRGGGSLQLYGDINDGFADIEFEPGYGLALAVGYDFGPLTSSAPGSDEMAIGARVDLELSYQLGNLDTYANIPIEGDVESTSVFFNGFLDLDFEGPFSIFVGVGVGTAEVRLDLPGFYSATDNALTVQAQLGLAYEVSEHVSVYVASKAQWFDTLEDAALGVWVENFNSSAIEFGVIYHF